MTRRSPPTARVIRLLELLAQAPGEPMTFSEIARRVDITRATCHALLLTLTEAGYLIRDPAAKTFTLGPALVELGEAARRSFPAIHRSHGELERLSERTGHPCLAIAPVDDGLLIVDRAGAAGGDRSVLGGRRIPFQPPFGAAAVAWATDAVAAAWIDRATAGGDRHRAELRAVLDGVRSDGYAVFPLDEAGIRFRAALSELSDDVLSDELRSMADRLADAVNPRDYLPTELRRGRSLPVDTITAPVFDADGAVGHLVCVQLVQVDTPPAEVTRIARELVDATTRMTRAEGGRVPGATERSTRRSRPRAQRS